MGLRCEVFLEDLGLPMATPVYGIEPFYGDGFDVFCDTFIQVSTAYCPVDTGYLQSTLTADTDGFAWAECYTDCEYAQYQEYGTWCMGAQPYFEPAIAEAFAAAIPLWRQAWQDALDEEQEILQIVKEAYNELQDFMEEQEQDLKEELADINAAGGGATAEEAEALDYQAMIVLAMIAMVVAVISWIKAVIQSVFQDMSKSMSAEYQFKVDSSYFIEIT